MQQRMRRLAQGAFAVAVAGALGYGATQAAASPAGAAVAGCTSDTWCQQNMCAPFDGYCDRKSGLCVCEG